MRAYRYSRIDRPKRTRRTQYLGNIPNTERDGRMRYYLHVFLCNLCMLKETIIYPVWVGLAQFPRTFYQLNPCLLELGNRLAFRLMANVFCKLDNNKNATDIQSAMQLFSDCVKRIPNCDFPVLVHSRQEVIPAKDLVHGILNTSYWARDAAEHALNFTGQQIVCIVNKSR